MYVSAVIIITPLYFIMYSVDWLTLSSRCSCNSVLIYNVSSKNLQHVVWCMVNHRIARLTSFPWLLIIINRGRPRQARLRRLHSIIIIRFIVSGWPVDRWCGYSKPYRSRETLITLSRTCIFNTFLLRLAVWLSNILWKWNFTRTDAFLSKIRTDII